MTEEVSLKGMGSGPGEVVTGVVGRGTLAGGGDILVTQMTDPSMVKDMGVARAVVTDTGGVVCHAAIVCREMGIPFVVGTGNASKMLKDGDIVTVDPASGTVVRS